MQILLSLGKKNLLIHNIYPVFTPFLGCERRCVFCAQHFQSGTPQGSLESTLITTDSDLRARQERGAAPVELGFFGGTFTASPPWALQRCLDFIRCHLALGTVACARCSTRPDAVPADTMQMVTDAGLGMVELGIQSFNTAALTASQRGYDADTARAACRRVREAGLRLGVQLLPGMPGVTPEIFLDDVRTALELGAHCLRFYPCLVLEDTELAALWRKGIYRPWDMDTTVHTLALGWNMAQEAGVPVIRMGLAPQAGLEAHILAGPTHPALGSAVQGVGLCERVHTALLRAGVQGSPFRVEAPERCRGYFWGHTGSLTARWRGMGLTEVTWISSDILRIIIHNAP